MQTENEILIDYLDQVLTRSESDAVESRLKSDPSFAGEYRYLKLAVETVRLNALGERVSAVRRSMDPVQPMEEKPLAIVRSISRNALRIAAVFIGIMGCAVLYKYISVDSSLVYQNHYAAYELNNTRGRGIKDAEAEAYQNKNWKAVVSIYDTKNDRSNKSTFLAAMAEMQLNNFPRAVALFEGMLNAKTGDSSYREESEYYLSLAYLMNHEVNKGVRLLDKIKSDTSHAYYPVASKISAIDLKIIDLKK